MNENAYLWTFVIFKNIKQIRSYQKIYDLNEINYFNIKKKQK